MSDAPSDIPSFTGQADWREANVMRRDYIDMLGDYIPRGQLHFKAQLGKRGYMRLSARSMEMLREAAERGDAVALQALQGDIIRRPALWPIMNTQPPRFYRSGDLPPRPEDMARVRRALQRGSLTRRELIEQAGLSQTRTLCSIDALIAAGEVVFDQAARRFSLAK